MDSLCPTHLGENLFNVDSSLNIKKVFRIDHIKYL